MRFITINSTLGVSFNNDTEKADEIYAGMTPLTPQDIAEAVVFAASRPKHANVSEIVIYPTDQADVQTVYRKKS